MHYFDAHTHLHFAAYDADRDESFAKAREAGVGVNLVGTQLDTSRAAIECAHRYPDTWATIGLHPTHTAASHPDAQELGTHAETFTAHGEEYDHAAYLALGRDEKVVAVGECGLDYFRCDESAKDAQKAVFLAQIALANELNKPLMLHIRDEKGKYDAYRDALELVRAHARVSCDVHFFAGDWDTARQWLETGAMLSFTGVVTFADQYHEILRAMPLERMMSETDAPYVAPVPYRGKRNESAYIPEIVRVIAQVREEDEEVVRAQLLANARGFFGL